MADLTITVPEISAVGNADGTMGIVTVGDPVDMEGALRYIIDADEGEPLFVIRGRDALAVPVLMAYMDECDTHCLHGQKRRVYLHVERFIGWQGDNAKLTHLPDPRQED